MKRQIDCDIIAAACGGTTFQKNTLGSSEDFRSYGKEDGLPLD